MKRRILEKHLQQLVFTPYERWLFRMLFDELEPVNKTGIADFMRVEKSTVTRDYQRAKVKMSPQLQRIFDEEYNKLNG